MTKTVEERLRAAGDVEAADLIKEMREALRDAREVFIVEYRNDGAVASVGHHSNALRPLVAKLDAALKRAEARNG